MCGKWAGGGVERECKDGVGKGRTGQGRAERKAAQAQEWDGIFRARSHCILSPLPQD